ncbi:hypothetical protein L198_07856 [Cryptococcus wingfieldii CBS 7118]|uniref:Uncharacterized protein n=1 Tax=Cryptococcus wingfieldii CBS 7118 TaxID=1295528 RepID=A0A1E3HV53_9TREE|nr:hypothetical protein L198_07856 [Cryptococcus wingfieldii CBS 7118]ODN80199.1 hypothetical protein L198_07856 [Cryptococcus wingfieldii CBS 7118]
MSDTFNPTDYATYPGSQVPNVTGNWEADYLMFQATESQAAGEGGSTAVSSAADDGDEFETYEDFVEDATTASSSKAKKARRLEQLGKKKTEDLRSKHRRASSKATLEKKTLLGEINRRTGGSIKLNQVTSVKALRDQLAWLDNAETELAARVGGLSVGDSNATFSHPPGSSWVAEWSSYPPQWFDNNSNQESADPPPEDDRL